MDALDKASDVGVTLAVWSFRRKSYIGETVYWFDDKLNRKSVCLAITRVKVKQMYDVLGRILEKTHVKFKILQKLSSFNHGQRVQFSKGLS